MKPERGRRRTLADYRALFRRPHPRWSMRTTALAGLVIVLVVSVVTLLVLKKPLWIELEALTAILSIVAFMFFGHVLYRGVRFNKRERFDFSLRTVSLEDIWDAARISADVPDFSDAFDLAEGIWGIILGILVSILLVFLLGFVLWIGLNVALNAVIVVSIPLFYLFRRSLRQVVARGRSCRGSMPRSLLVAAWMTFLYMGWFYSLIYFAHLLGERLRSG